MIQLNDSFDEFLIVELIILNNLCYKFRNVGYRQIIKRHEEQI